MTQKIALITGGVGGIGTAISKALAEDGFFVIANYVVPGSDTAWIQTMAAAGYDSKHCGVIHADVSDFAACEKMITAVLANHGPVDVLVNCAGITRDANFRKMSLEQWRAVISTNLDSAFNVTKQVIEGMVTRGYGRVINISSVNGVKGAFGQTNYSAAKAGIVGFTKALALEVASKGITVNAVSPGFIDTPMTQAMPSNRRDDIVEAIPCGRMGVPEDIANAVRFLASDRAAYITGTNLSVNGGVHMHQ